MKAGRFQMGAEKPTATAKAPASTEKAGGRYKFNGDVNSNNNGDVNGNCNCNGDGNSGRSKQRTYQFKTRTIGTPASPDVVAHVSIIGGLLCRGGFGRLRLSRSLCRL